MEDSVEDVNRKVKKAYCPPLIAEKNPILDYVRSIILPSMGSISIALKEVECIFSSSSTDPLLLIQPSSKETVVYEDYATLEADFVSGRIHPSELKPVVAKAINDLIEPVRLHFASGEPKALLDKIKKFKVTR